MSKRKRNNKRIQREVKTREDRFYEREEREKKKAEGERASKSQEQTQSSNVSAGQIIFCTDSKPTD